MRAPVALKKRRRKRYAGLQRRVLSRQNDISPCGKINIPPPSGGYFGFGHSPNITGCA